MNKSNTKPYNYLVGYDVRKTRNGKIWTRIATAWPHHKDKDGFTVELNVFPLTGTLCSCPRSQKRRPSQRSLRSKPHGAGSSRAFLILSQLTPPKK